MTDFRQAILDERYKLILAEALLDARVKKFTDDIVRSWIVEFRRLLSIQDPTGMQLSRLRSIGGILHRMSQLTAAQVKQLHKAVGPSLPAILKDAYYKNSWLVDGVQVSAPGTIGVAFGGLNVRAMQQALRATLPGLDQTQSFAGLTTRAINAMKSDLATAIAEGWDITKLADKWTNGGGAGRIAHEARTIARTSAMKAANQGALRAFEDAGPEVVQWIQWEATFDLRTCLRCSSLHGQIFPLSQAPPMPLHFQCRCIPLPVFVDASFNKMLKQTQAYSVGNTTRFRQANRSFELWLGKQHADALADYFPSQLKRWAWQYGGLRLDQLVDPAAHATLTDRAVYARLRATGAKVPAHLVP